MYVLASKRTLDAHPTSSFRYSGSRASKNGCCVRNRSSVSIVILHGARLGNRGAVADRAHLLCDIDSDRAPGDAPPAPDTTRTSELIDPGGEFVRHPLAIAGLWRRSHAAAMNVRKLLRETGVPPAPPLGVIAGHIANILHGRAKAGRADHRAVR